MSPADRPVRYKFLFWRALACEALFYPLFVLLLNVGVPIGGYGGMMLLGIAIGLGMLVCVAGVFIRVIRKPALLLLPVHLSLPWVFWHLGDIPNYFLWRHIRGAMASQEAFSQFEGLLKQGRLVEARGYMDAHPEMGLHGLVRLQGAFCALGEQELDRELLLKTRKRANLSAGDELTAAASCSARITAALLKEGIAPDVLDSQQKLTPLMTGTHVAALKVLIAHGADVNAKTDFERRPLMYHRTPEITQLLLEHGADAKALTRGDQSALHYDANVAGLAECYELLIQAGANPNLRDSGGETPLINLGSNWDYRAANVLVAHGADPMVLSSLGDTALERAIRRVDPSNLTWPTLHLEGPYGARLLREAKASGAWEVFDALIAAGANPVLPDVDGQSALEAVGVPGPGSTAERRARCKRLQEAAARFQTAQQPAPPP